MAGSVLVRDMTTDDAIFVGTCSHVDESAEIDRCGERRLAWLREESARGVRAKVALLDGHHAGFLYVVPIEICPWGPLGEDLLVVPCMFVPREGERHGVGRALLAAAELEVERQDRSGLVTMAFGHEGWFMPAGFFEAHGYEVAARRGPEVILWKLGDARTDVALPRFLEPTYEFHPVREKVVIDLFWNRFCLTSEMEAERVHDVARKFGDLVVVRDHAAEDRETLERFQIPRAIYIQGERIDWGYEAPREGVREAIERALTDARLRV